MDYIEDCSKLKGNKTAKSFFGDDKEQYFLYYEPLKVQSDKVVIWVHGGGWNAGSPESFDMTEALENLNIIVKIFKKQVI